jgi:hypothetical protein
MRTKFYIENQELSISEDIDMALTMAIDDVKNFGSRNTTFSKTIVLPGNAVNNKIFGHVFMLGSSNEYNEAVSNVGFNFNPSVSARCVSLVDNIQVFKGNARLIEVVDTDGELEYEIFVTGELGGFMFQLGNRRLEDLDFSEYDLLYSYANIVASWNNINGAGVYFPLIDYGNVSANKQDFQYTAFRPALYAREYLEKISSGTEYTIVSNFLLSSLLDRLGVGHNQKVLTNNTTNVLTLLSAGGQSISVTGDDEVIYAATGGLFTPSFDNKEFTYNSPTPITIVFTGTAFGVQNLTANVFALSIQKNGTDVAGSTQYFTAAGVEIPWFYSKTVTINLVQNDVIRVHVNKGGGLLFDEYITVNGGSGSGQSSTPTASPVVLGDTISINDSIPKGIFQRDFFIWFLKMFNLYVYENAFDEKKLYIEPYVDFYPPTPANALDWSGKIDRKQPMRSVTMSELNARYYQFKFKEDSDFYSENYRKAFNEGYGDYNFDTEFEFSKDTDVLEVGFAQSVLYQNIGTDKVYPAIYKLSGTTETPMDHVIRLMQFKKVACDSWDMLNGETVLGSLTEYGYGGHVDDPVTPTNDIGFGVPRQLQFTPGGPYPVVNIFSIFHEAYMNEITNKDSKLIIARAYLTPLDILKLDFSTLIFIDGVLFRLNKIANYNPIALNTTEIQLLKAINL